MQCDHRKRANRIPSASATVRRTRYDLTMELRINRCSALSLGARDELHTNLPHLFEFFLLIALATLLFTSIKDSPASRTLSKTVLEFPGKSAFRQQARDVRHN